MEIKWLEDLLALAFVEIFRNTPLLIQIVFWYIGVFSLLPMVKQTVDISLGAEMLLLNNRGLYLATPVAGNLFWLTPLALAIAAAGVVLLRRKARKLQARTG